MKKLMTMIAAVAMSFGLFADGVVDPFLSGAGFDTKDETAGRYSYTYGDPGTFSSLWTVTEGLTWTAGATKSGEKVVPNEFSKAANDGYMALKTTLGNPVFQKVNTDGSQRIGDDLFFDGLVKFTAFDETPQVYDSKIAVYLKQTSETDDTQVALFVRAAGATAGSTNDYEVSVVGGIAADTWYRLTIKSIADIDGSGKVAFMVFVDNKAVSCTGAIIASGLQAQYDRWGKLGELFVSLEQNDVIKGVGFDGQGAIDDIVFTTEVPFDDAATPQVMKVQWPSTVSKVKIDDGEWMSVSPTNVDLVTSGTIYWEGVGDFLDGNKPFSNIASGGTLTITEGEVTLAAASVTIGATTTKFAALEGDEGAIVKVNGATEAATLKLITNADGPMAFANNKAIITVDLNGQEAQAISVTLAGTKIVIDDMSVGAAGIVKGTASKTGMGSSITANAGKFLVSANPTMKDVTPKEGFTFAEITGYWELVPAYTITINEPTNGTLETSVTNKVIEGTVVTVKPTPETGYELDSITVMKGLEPVSLADYTFMMPAGDVTVSATFKPVKPAEITITIKKTAEIASVTYDSAALVFDGNVATLTLPADTTAVTLTLAAVDTIKIPVFTFAKGADVLGWNATGKETSYDVAADDTLNFAAEEANVQDPAITDKVAADAVADAAKTDAAKAKVTALTTGEGAIGGKALANWINTKAGGDVDTALEGDYVKASIKLDVEPIDESTEIEIKELETGANGALTFAIDIEDETMVSEAQLNAIKDMVKATSDVADWTTVEKQLEVTAVPNVEDGTVTVTPTAATDKAFMKVVIPQDAK